MIRKLTVAAAALMTLSLGTAHAQTVNGYATILTVPLVVQTSTFQSQLFIHNPSGSALSITPSYRGADGSSHPTAFNCPAISVPASGTGQYSLTSLCPSLNGTSEFGRIRFQENSPQNVPFTIFSRVQNFAGHGFSVEGFPIGNFGGNKGSTYINGLQRQAAAPGYQTNCFIASLEEAIGIDLQLSFGDGTFITSVHYDLAANQMVRLLDVFATMGAPAGDYSNVRLTVGENGPNEPAVLAFCTVQNNAAFDADFRIAKEPAPSGDDKLFFSFTGFTSGSTSDLAGNALPSLTGSNSHHWGIVFQHPDWVQCSTSGVAGGGGIEIRLVRPDGTVQPGAGGNGLSAFGEVYLGEKSTVNSGVNGTWDLQVESNGGTISAYTLECDSGNGHTRPIFSGTGLDVF